MGLSVVRDPGEEDATIKASDDEPWEYSRAEGGVDVGNNDLADAAANAIDDGDGLKLVQEQTALVPACKVKFNGMSYDSLQDVPDLKAEVAYLAIGRVNGHEELISAQGDLREVAKVKVATVRPIPDDKLQKILDILDN